MKCEACRKGKARGFDADGVHLCAACLAVCIPDERSGAECHDCGTLTDSREADDAGRCAECQRRAYGGQRITHRLETLDGMTVTNGSLDHCRATARQTGLRTRIVEEPLPKPVTPAEREGGAPARPGEVGK